MLEGRRYTRNTSEHNGRQVQSGTVKIMGRFEVFDDDQDEERRRKGAFIYDVRTQGVERVVEKQTKVLISCVSGTVTRERG